ncbi:MAG: replication protein [Bacillota bacterium]
MTHGQSKEFTRISNELLEAILATNFTKRQLNIILLVIRLSYGCGKQHALIKPLEFSLAGIYRADIKKELVQLAGAGVLTLEGDKVALNKDYEAWRVGPTQTWDRGRYKDVIRRNLSSLSSLPDKVSVSLTGKVSETLTGAPEAVSKTLTPGLVKHEPESSQNTNQGVSETLTNQTLQPYSPKGSRGAERNLKKIKETIKKDPPLYPPPGGYVQEDQAQGLSQRWDKEWESAKTAPGAQKSGSAPTVGKVPEYTLDFLRFWAAYPRKNDKRKAFRCWQARLKEGLAASDLLAAAENYAAYCKKHGTEERYVKHAATFLGPDRPCLEWVSRDTVSDKKKEFIRSLYLS